MQRGEPARALRMFQEVAALAARVGDGDLEADAELGRGESLYLMEDRERESLQHLRRAADLAPGTVTAALAWMMTGDVLRFCGDVEPALAAYGYAGELFMGLQDAFGECLVRQATATLLIAQGRGGEALPHLARATSQALDADEPGRTAELVLMRGELLLELKRGSEAAPVLSAAAQMFQVLDERQQEMRARAKLVVALGLGKENARKVHEQQIRMAELAAEYASQEGDAELEGASHMMLAHLLSKATFPGDDPDG